MKFSKDKSELNSEKNKQEETSSFNENSKVDVVKEPICTKNNAFNQPQSPDSQKEIIDDLNEKHKNNNIPVNGQIKKKPGRPRKNPIREPKPRNGVVEKPTNENNYIEFLYDKPMVFKKMWGYYKPWL